METILYSILSYAGFVLVASALFYKDMKNAPTLDDNGQFIQPLNK